MRWLLLMALLLVGCSDTVRVCVPDIPGPPEEDAVRTMGETTLVWTFEVYEPERHTCLVVNEHWELRGCQWVFTHYVKTRVDC